MCGPCVCPDAPAPNSPILPKGMTPLHILPIGMTPLHMAAWAGKEGSVKVLLEHRALPNLPAHSGDTPLHLAAQHGYSSCVSVEMRLLARKYHFCAFRFYLGTDIRYMGQVLGRICPNGEFTLTRKNLFGPFPAGKNINGLSVSPSQKTYEGAQKLSVRFF